MVMGWDDAAILALSGLSGLFGNKPQQQTQTSTNENYGETTGTQGGGGVSINRPEFDFFSGALRENLFTKYLNMLNQDPNLTGYRAGQVSNMNRLADIQKRNSMETLASRGVSGPATATAANNIDNNRFSNIVGLDRDLPFMKQNMNLDLMQKAASLFQTIPNQMVNENSYGSNTTGTNYGTGTQTTIGTMPGNQTGGFLGNLTNMLAFLMGNKGEGTPRRSTVIPMQ